MHHTLVSDCTVKRTLALTFEKLQEEMHRGKSQDVFSDPYAS